MFRSPSSALLVAIALLLPASSLRAQSAPGPSGHWAGQIQIPDHVLNMTVDLMPTPTGAWIGSMTIVESTAVDVPLDTVTVDDEAVRFTAGLPDHTSFQGALSADAHELSGTASNDMGGVPFQLTRRSEPHVKIPPPSSPLPRRFEGTWEGILESGGQARRVQVKLGAKADGTATATLISVDKGNLEIPVTTVTLHESELQLDARAISGRFRGTLGSDGAIAGEWTEGTMRFPLTLKHVS